MSKPCAQFKCQRLPKDSQPRAVWTIDGRPYCNTCFLNWCDTHEIGRERIVRLFNDEASEGLYDDTRKQKRRRRSNTMGGGQVMVA